MARRNDKRSRLIAAADKLFHEQGVNTTTLANIAQLADVPLGNVYYYFKSKDSIVTAVIEHRRRIIQQQFDNLNTLGDAKSRLQGLLKQNIEDVQVTSNFGDILGSLCQELGKQGGKISTDAASIMNDIVHWVENQFASLGKDAATANQMAINLVATMQGMNLLTLTFKNADYARNQTQYLIDWIDSV